MLVGARDLDPGEERLLDGSEVRRASVEDLAGGAVELPPGPLYLHLDLDVADPADVSGLLFPVSGGPSLEGLEAAVGAVAASGRVVATCLALTLEPGTQGAERVLEVGRRLIAAAGA
jgi:arginase